MKCSHCKSEWSVSPSLSITLAKCPFCGKSLLPEKETLNTIEDVLIEINRLFGISVLTDKSKLIAYFGDLAPQLSKQRRILKYFTECNGPQKIAAVMHASEDEQSACIKRIVREMRDELFIEESTSQMVCNAFLRAMTGGRIAEVTTQTGVLQQNMALKGENLTDSLTMEEQYQKGEAYYFGTDTVLQDYKKAFTWYQRAALRGHPLAQCQLGLMYREGQGITKDEKKAFDWFMKAADDQQACPRGKFYVARSYHYGNGVPVDYEEAVKWYLTAAQQEDAYAQLNLGSCFERGEGVSKDLQMAAYWYERAAKQEEPLAQCNLGVMYLRGRGVTKDASKAIALFRKAADHHESYGIYMLGRCYLYGEGVKKDVNQAYVLIKQAAEKGDIQAQLDVAGYYMTGKVVEKNPDIAVRWYRKAAEGGSVPAMVILSECYERGNILPKDEAQTIYWLEKAVQKDYQFAICTFLLILADRKNLTEANCKTFLRFVGSIDEIMVYPLIKPVLLKHGYQIAHEMVSYTSTQTAGMKIMNLLAENGSKEAQIWLGR